MYLEFEPIPYGPDRSFASILFEGDSIVCPYHRHPELELVAIDSSRGRVVVGNYSGTFREGDIFLIGENIPHIFQNSRADHPCSARTQVIQFRRDFAGEHFFDIPELCIVRRLLRRAKRGLKLKGRSRETIRARMLAVHQAKGATRITRLVELLETIAVSSSHSVLQHDVSTLETSEDTRMANIVAYIQENLSLRISVPDAARRANLTPNAFCRFFKKQTRRTFTDFVNDLRITEACRLLQETNRSVAEICHASGFSSLSHFHKEFKQRTGSSPSDLRERVR